MKIEKDKKLRAGEYERPINYTFDRSLRKGKGGFYYVFNEGGLSCSKTPELFGEVCLVSTNEMSLIASEHPSFVYLDCGGWLDNPDGKNTKRRDFGLVCGPHVYLCEFVRGKKSPVSSVPSVQNLFNDLAKNGCGVRVLRYAQASPPMAETTPNDPTLYLFLGDCHLPPATWFYKQSEHVGITTSMERDPPDWLANTKAFKRQPSHLYRNYYTLSQLAREKGSTRVASGPITGNPDIFKAAGVDLVAFINGLSNVSNETKKLLHFIQTGDMLEMWLGREYQFKQGHYQPEWLDKESVNRVSDWGLEIMIQNTPVFEALQRLENAGLAEVKFVWGNHDAYLKSKKVTDQLNLPSRDPTYTGLNRDLFAEHGHRFDRSNYDNVSAWAGPAGANAAYYVPVVRKAEPVARKLTSIGHPSKELDCYLLGATLIYLYQKYDQKTNPFSIYVMGHSHNRKLFTFNIKAKYHLYAVP